MDRDTLLTHCSRMCARDVRDFADLTPMEIEALLRDLVANRSTTDDPTDPTALLAGQIARTIDRPRASRPWEALQVEGRWNVVEARIPDNGGEYQDYRITVERVLRVPGLPEVTLDPDELGDAVAAGDLLHCPRGCGAAHPIAESNPAGLGYLHCDAGGGTVIVAVVDGAGTLRLAPRLIGSPR